MKKISTAFVAASLLALGACGGGGGTSTEANNTSDELYNLTEEDLGGNLLDANAIDANALEAPPADLNVATGNEVNAL